MVDRRFIRSEPRWLDLVEAAYAPATDEVAWAQGIVSAATRHVFDDVRFVGALGVQHIDSTLAIAPRFSIGPVSLPSMADPSFDFGDAGPAIMKVFFHPPTMVNTHLRLDPQLPAAARAMLAEMRRGLGCTDVAGLVVHPTPESVAVLFAASEDRIGLSRHDERRLTQMAIHMEAGLRLRLRPEVVKAVIEPSGKVVHREPDAPKSEILSAHTKRVDSARTRKRRQEPESLDLWTALVQGRMSLIERSDAAKRFYLVVENPPERRPIRAMTPTELDVVSEAARGLSAKLIAYGLGISAPTVSARLLSAASKLGLASRIELVRVAAILCQDPRASFDDAALTAAEREVLELLSAGLTNREIAAARNRSTRTIANQVAKLLAKTGSPTRRALAARI